MYANRALGDSLQPFRNSGDNQPAYGLPPQGEIRKKIQNYSFLLCDKIGKGYSSTVYRGMNDLTGDDVAIKVIELKSLRDETSKHMLSTEIACFREVRHPNLLRYENSYFTVNNCYIITEYCSQGDLSKILKDNKKFTEEEVGKLFHQIYAAYLHFHNAGYIHRDIKPANIFVTASGELKIADFGFCKKRTLIERENYNVGTPIYMPRESLAANIYNEKTDVWSLGITLYEMIFGEVPFKGKTEAELRAEIERGVVVFPTSNPISNELKDFILNCLLNDSFRRMSIKDMHKHPWLAKIIQEIQAKNTTIKDRYSVETTESVKINPPQLITRHSLEDAGRAKIGESAEKDNRISLPNGDIHLNKSKGYFDCLGVAKENRRSISSMQKLKICHPKKASQIIDTERTALANKSTSYINMELTKNKKTEGREDSIMENNDNKENLPSNRISVTISTQASFNSLKPKPTKTTKPLKENTQINGGIEKIVALINYFRLLYKMYEKIQMAIKEILDSEIKTELTYLLEYITREINDNLSKHIASSQAKTNSFNLNGKFWSEFSQSERWQMYVYVIDRYQQKYSSLRRQQSQQPSRQLKNKQDWGNFFLSFFEKMKSFQDFRLVIKDEKYALYEIVYYLQRFVSLYSLVDEQGWENFTEVMKNGEQIVSDSFAVTLANYYDISRQMQQKAEVLRITLSSS